ncbi:phosphotransferase [Clostridium cibarium]|uniref:Phosphotransferase n=1 Tax=Clostridium cibarium TaxID=2762247 RepID=A0ABR8PTX0_9CLOT|nr:phosphotransferase [Clostridium cibarium]MBD7911588.1 phosphotransferase [Clostridium cibarium]
MDNVWERSIPFYNLSIKEITAIFTEYDKNFEILNYTPIYVGCRNSNYKIHTNKGYFLLRVCPLKDISYKKERFISELFYGYINVPKLLFVSENNITQRICLIYEYVNGNSMQEMLIQKGKLEDRIIVEVAESASYIHNCNILNKDEFHDDYPPFLTWYDLFLEKEIVTERIGKEIKERVKTLIADKKRDLYEIDKYISFIHSDFHPANMIIDKNNRIWIVDWEFSGFGHSLGDIGQFFRYENSFNQRQIEMFEKAYNSSSNRVLPSNWYGLSKLRDLVNPLQMLGAKENLPQKYIDLKNIVLNILVFFGY